MVADPEEMVEFRRQARLRRRRCRFSAARVFFDGIEFTAFTDLVWCNA